MVAKRITYISLPLSIVGGLVLLIGSIITNRDVQTIGGILLALAWVSIVYTLAAGD